MAKTNEELEKEIKSLKEVIATLILWIIGSAVSPITSEEGNQLITLLKR